MVATLRLQAEARLRDLLWQPAAVTNRLAEIVSDVSPTLVVSDQLAFGSTLALRVLEQPYVSFHPGHPSAIPGPGELYGFPSHRPSEFRAGARELGQLRSLCADVSDRFTLEFNATLRQLNPRAEPVVSALSATSPLLTLVNYPAELAGPRRALLPSSARFIGASVRRTPELDRQLPGLPGAQSFAAAHLRLPRQLPLRPLGRSSADRLRVPLPPVQLVVAAGVTPPGALGDVPDGWHVASYLPQPEVISSCDLVICHGGNNTVTSALGRRPAARLPVFHRPVRRRRRRAARRVGDVFDPNTQPPRRSPPARCGCSQDLFRNGRRRSHSR